MTFHLRDKMLVALAVALALMIGVVVSGCGGGTETVTVTVSETAETEAGAEGDEEGQAEDVAEEEEAAGNCAELDGEEGTCEEEGTTFVVVNKSGTLKLPTLKARLLDITEQKSASALGETATASGVFVTFELEITNLTREPVEFDPYQEQVSLLVGGNVFSEDFDVQNGLIESSFIWQGGEIQPQNTATGTVTFDVPTKLAKQVAKDGNLNIGNFGEGSFGEENVNQQSEIGVIRTYQ